MGFSCLRVSGASNQNSSRLSVVRASSIDDHSLELQQMLYERHMARGHRLLEDDARQAIDLDDQKPALRTRRRRAAPHPPYGAIDRVLEGYDEIVERHRPVLVAVKGCYSSCSGTKGASNMV
jgi:hypothetical protein